MNPPNRKLPKLTQERFDLPDLMTWTLRVAIALVAMPLLISLGLAIHGSLESFATEEQEEKARIGWSVICGFFLLIELALLGLHAALKRPVS
jgi:hypothetical protein